MNSGGNAGNTVGSVQAAETAAHTHSMGTGSADSTAMASFPASNRLSHFLADGYNFGSPKSTDPVGGNETRPKNAYVNFIIRT